MWPRLINAALGLWLMVAPAVLDYGDPARANDRIAGPLAASVAVIAIWEVARPLRWLNVALGLWLLAAPWLLGYPAVAALNSTAVGLVLGGCALIRGRLQQRVGGGWRAVWSPVRSADDQSVTGGGRGEASG